MGYILAPFEIKFMPQKAVKEQTIADFLVAHPCPSNEDFLDDMPNDAVMLVETKLCSHILMRHQVVEELEQLLYLSHHQKTYPLFILPS